jgi:hypothetical protein
VERVASGKTSKDQASLDLPKAAPAQSTGHTEPFCPQQLHDLPDDGRRPERGPFRPHKRMECGRAQHRRKAINRTRGAEHMTAATRRRMAGCWRLRHW